MQATTSHPSLHTHKRLEDLEEAFEDSKAERNSLSHQIEQIVEFVQGLHSILQQTQQRLDALESFQATVATHQHQLSAPEGLLNGEQGCISQTPGSHGNQADLPGLRPPHLGSHHSSSIQAATLKRPSTAPASLLTSHLHAITMRATVSPLLHEDKPSHKAKTGLLVLNGVSATGGIPARHASAVHAVQKQLLPVVQRSQSGGDAALSDSSTQDALGKTNQTGTLHSSTPDSLTQNSHRTVCNISTAVADENKGHGRLGNSSEASNQDVAIDAVIYHNGSRSIDSNAPTGIVSSCADSACCAPSQPMSSAAAAATALASAEGADEAANQQDSLHKSVASANAAEDNAGESVTAAVALAADPSSQVTQGRCDYTSPFQHASVQQMPTKCPLSSAPSMAESYDTQTAAQKPTAAGRAVTALPDQDDALGCALAAEQSFLSMGAGSLCGDSEVSGSEDYDGLVCFNEGVQVAPPPLDDAVEEGPCGMYRQQHSSGFGLQQDEQRSLGHPQGDGGRARSHYEASVSGSSREVYPQFGQNSLLGYHEREWLQSMEDSEAASQHSQSGQQQQHLMSYDEWQQQQSMEAGSAPCHQEQPSEMTHGPGDDSTGPHGGMPDAHVDGSADSYADMYGEYARISLDGAGHENWNFCLRRRVQRGPGGRHGAVVDDRAHSVGMTLSSRRLHRAAMSDAKRAFLLSRAEAAQGEWPLQRMKKRRVCRKRLEACQPARKWWQLFTG